MGAWAVDAFGNDDACDWAVQLESKGDLSLVEQTLEAVVSRGDAYLEAPEASEGVAAAETVARLLGKFGDQNVYTEQVDVWVRGVKLVPSVALRAKACAALDRICSEPSELLELWRDSDEFDAWTASIQELRGRIA